MSSDFVGDDDFPPAEESDPASDLSSKILSEDGDDVEPVEKSTEDEELESDNEGQQAENGSSQKDSQLIVDDEDEGGEQQREQETEEGEGEGDKSKEDEEIEESKEDNEPDSIGDDLESGDEGEEAQDGRVKKKRRLIVDDDDDEDEDGEKGDPESEESKEDDEANESLGKSIGTLLSEDEDEGTEGTEEAEDGRSKKKRRLIVEDDEEDEDGEKEDKEDDDLLEKSNEDEAEAEGEAEGGGGGGEVEAEGLDDGEGEGEGEGDAEGEEAGGTSKMKDPAVPDLSSDEESDDDGKRRSKVPDDFVYDFDLMMARKKEESYRSRKRKNIDIINDNDDIIADLITQMKQSADEDFELNKNRKAATCKLRLLPVVETQLRKIDLRESFLDAGVLGVITDWLTPLPDRSLPNLQVRETMLKLLGEFNIMDVERLKASGIGKAVMYLFKHPKETKDNKKRAGVLISSWSRPIFSLDTDFHSMSKEEREQRDFDHMTKLTENKRGRTEPKTPPSSSRKGQAESEKTLRPGDKGWIPRARVPAPSTRDYVVRPKSTVDSEMSKSGSKKAITRLDKHLRNFREKKKLMKTQRAVPISIEGRRMTL